MLNTKYIIQTDSTGAAFPTSNPNANGNAWFVEKVKFVNSPDEEMKALDTFNPSDTAVIDDVYAPIIKSFLPTDSAASIKMTSFDNDAITYQTNTTANHLALFSEIYYKDWKAYIDGKNVDFAKANYVLRGMMVPAGNHKIVFIFEPKSYYQGVQISSISSWLLTFLFIGIISMLLLKKNKEQSI